MTERKISLALNRIRAGKNSGFQLEALLQLYWLNLDLLRFLTWQGKVQEPKTESPKKLVKHLKTMLDHDPGLRAVIQKRSLNHLKPWLEKMNGFFKDIRHHKPGPVSPLYLESEKVFGILKISVNKLLLKKKDKGKPSAGRSAIPAVSRRPAR